MAADSRDLQLIELKDMISQLNTTIKTLNETIAKQQAENDSLKAELAWFRHKLFGSSSERGKIGIEGQLCLFDDLAGEDEKPAELIEPEVVLEGKKTRKRKLTLIAGSYVSESLLAYVIYRKYGLYVPLYRQEQDFLQLGAPIGRTLATTR